MEIQIKRFSELTVQQLYAILKQRSNIFVVEQNCAFSDMDNYDQIATHIWLEDNGNLLSYARVLPNNTKHTNVSFGRIISVVRRKGYATHVLNAALSYAKATYDAKEVDIDAQVVAIPFYESIGFVVVGEPFLEDNIAHVRMRYYVK